MFFWCFVLFCFVAVYFETQKQVLEAGHPCFLLSSMPLSPGSAKCSLHLSFVLSAILVSYIFLSGSVKKKIISKHILEKNPYGQISNMQVRVSATSFQSDPIAVKHEVKYLNDDMFPTKW